MLMVDESDVCVQGTWGGGGRTGEYPLRGWGCQVPMVDTDRIGVVILLYLGNRTAAPI